MIYTALQCAAKGDFRPLFRDDGPDALPGKAHEKNPIHLDSHSMLAAALFVPEEKRDRREMIISFDLVVFLTMNKRSDRPLISFLSPLCLFSIPSVPVLSSIYNISLLPSLFFLRYSSVLAAHRVLQTSTGNDYCPSISSSACLLQ